MFEKNILAENPTQLDTNLTEASAGTPVIKTPEVKSPQNYFTNSFFSNDNLIISQALLKEKFRNDIIKEVENFRVLVTQNKSKLIYETDSSKIFWLDRIDVFPYLSKLALILSNINSSSAFIERFFSICGFVEDKRQMNITQDLFTTRCLLRANIKILNELEEK